MQMFYVGDSLSFMVVWLFILLWSYLLFGFDEFRSLMKIWIIVSFLWVLFLSFCCSFSVSSFARVSDDHRHRYPYHYQNDDHGCDRGLCIDVYVVCV